jgi:predicted transcriptional regulator
VSRIAGFLGERSGFNADGAGVIPLGIIPAMAMTLRLTDEQTAKLRATAEREGVSMQAVALKAIDEYVDRRMQRRDEIIEQIFTEDAQLFRRLADS